MIESCLLICLIQNHVAAPGSAQHLRFWGCFAGVLYLLRPLIDAAQPVALTMELIVSAGQPVRIDVAGEGLELLASSPLHLGQQLPPVALTLLDEEGPARAPCFR